MVRPRRRAWPGRLMTPKATHHIAILDDSATVRELVAALLREAGHTVDACASWSELEQAIERRTPDLVLLDVEMPTIVGDHIGFALKRGHPELRVVFLSDHDVATLQAMSERTGVDGYIHKSADPEELLRAVAAQLSSADGSGEP
jgi:two-component system OmpR family response regulator